MKNSRLHHQCLWLVNVLRRCGQLTLNDLQTMWVDDRVADGRPLPRSTFHRHRAAIVDLFGIIIECDNVFPYYYKIVNPELLNDVNLDHWMLSTLTVGDVLWDSKSVSDRILLEEIPAGDEYLPIIISALKGNWRLLMGYRRFESTAYQTQVEPLALKLSNRRWYLLAWNGKHISTYSLDRMTSLKQTGEHFIPHHDISPKRYYGEYYGVLTDGTPMAHVVIRAYGMVSNYLRTLPLHPSQHEVGSGEGYTDFALDLRPTRDFIDVLLSHGANIEVLEPTELRKSIIEALQAAVKRYE